MELKIHSLISIIHISAFTSSGKPYVNRNINNNCIIRDKSINNNFDYK